MIEGKIQPGRYRHGESGKIICEVMAVFGRGVNRQVKFRRPFMGLQYARVSWFRKYFERAVADAGPGDPSPRACGDTSAGGDDGRAIG